MRELLELMPINVRPQLAALCEQCFRTAQKAASVQGSLDEFKRFQAEKKVPPQISVRPYVLQCTKEFLGAGEYRTPVSLLEEKAQGYALQILDHLVQMKAEEVALLRKEIAYSRWNPVVEAIAVSAKERLDLTFAEGPAWRQPLQRALAEVMQPPLWKKAGRLPSLHSLGAQSP